MTIKRLILILLTFFAVAKVVLSLGESLGQPQVQGRLELYQTNFVLYAAEYEPQLEDKEKQKNLSQLVKNLVGEQPYAEAEKKYREVRETVQENLNNLQEDQQPVAAGTSPQQQMLQTQITEMEETLSSLSLRIGILQAQQGEVEKARQTWTKLQKEDTGAGKSQTAQLLRQLWQEPPQVEEGTETKLEENLDGWFRYRVLQRLYQVQGQEEALAELEISEQQQAQQALIKLSIISGIPALGGILGVGLLVFLLVQLLIQGKESLLATNQGIGWETPWDWEITWQVLIVGFFFIGQFLLPLLFGLVFGFSGINPANFSLRAKAVYVLATYFLMALGGLLVLYWSVKPFLPLPEGWFRLQWLSNWLGWGLGGYLVALPVVVVVSLLNQQIWQGQGGSNPIILLALQAQDKVALIIFFLTASLAAPLFEEVMFRGFLLPSLTRYLPVWGSILVSSLVFSVAHLSLSEVLPLTALGIILGIVYTRSRNLLAPMLLHSLWNGGTLLSLFVLGSQT